MQRLERQRVPVAVFRRPAYDDLALEFPELDAYIKGVSPKSRTGRLAAGTRSYLLMDAKQATGTDAKTGWPCFRPESA